MSNTSLSTTVPALFRMFARASMGASERRRWKLIREKLKNSPQLMNNNQDRDCHTRSLAHILHLVSDAANHGDSEIDALNTTANLREALIEFKVKASALGYVPVASRKIYALSIDILATLSPDAAKEVRAYRPRRAFQTILKELTDNPLALTRMTPEESRTLWRMVLINGFLFPKKHAAEDPEITIDPRWGVIQRAGALIERPLLEFHSRAASWLGENCPLISFEETDESFCNRLVNDTLRIYGINTPCRIILKKDDANRTGGSYEYNPEAGTHEITFTNFHILNPVEKFLLVMHECAAHMVRREWGFNKHYRLPEQLFSDIFDKPNIQELVVTQSAVTKDTTLGSSEKPSNYSVSVAAFGNKRGYQMYRADKAEREAKFVEAMALAGIYKRKKEPFISELCAVHAWNLVEQDLNPDAIRPIQNLGLLLARIEPPH